MGKRADRQRGQSLVEFSLVIGFLFLTIFGIVEFSRLFFAYGTMSHQVRELARYAVVHRRALSEAEIQDAEDRIIMIGGTATITASYPVNASGEQFCSHKCLVVVTARSTYDAWMPFVPTFEMVARATLHYE